jgi:transcriptional regulator GlxA family with amidase domain
MNIGIYIYDGVEVLDFTGPFEVFTTATRVFARLNPDSQPLFKVFLVAEDLRIVKARGEFLVQPHYTTMDHPSLDVLVIPGGVHEGELEKRRVISWISRISAKTDLTVSVCTGAFLLAQAGLLNEGPCTTHWEDIPALQAQFPSLDVREGIPWVDNGHIITSAGISSGIEMALHIVNRLGDRQLALRTAHQMQYRWNFAHLSKEKDEI